MTAATPRRLALLVLAVPAVSLAQAQPAPPRSGNPIIPGWYADPEAHTFAGQYWIYPTYSAPYNQQVFMDAFSSRDLITWTKHERIIDTASVKWAWRAMWAPSVVAKDNRYYLFFGANDIQSDSQPRGGGIGVAVSDKPEGPFRDHLGRPLIDKFHNGAQPIDQMVFRDADGKHYIIYGGWRHCNIAQLNDDFTGFVPFPDGSTFKEITPEGYVEGAYMMLKDGKYYFMWSEGGWTGPNYSVAYAIGDSPLGPFKRIGKILQQDSTIATGAGHHSILHAEGSPNWYIVYHRRPLGERDRNHRVVSIDELHFNADGTIRPVKITKEGVAADPFVGPSPEAIAIRRIAEDFRRSPGRRAFFVDSTGYSQRSAVLDQAVRDLGARGFRSSSCSPTPTRCWVTDDVGIVTISRPSVQGESAIVVISMLTRYDRNPGGTHVGSYTVHLRLVDGSWVVQTVRMSAS